MVLFTVGYLWIHSPSQGTIDCPDLDFLYDDTDKHTNEIAELYSYTEGAEFQLNIKVCTCGKIFNNAGPRKTQLLLYSYRHLKNWWKYLK